MSSDSLAPALRETLTLFDSPGKPWTTTEIADRLDLGRRSSYERLERLVDRGRLDTKKVGANGRVWWRPPDQGSENTAGRSEPPEYGTSIQFQSLVEAVEEYAIFILDTEGRVESWNSGAEHIKGYASDEIIGEHFSTFYTEEDRKAGIPGANLAKATENGSIEDEGWRVRADGSRFWANVTITAIYDDHGEPRGFAKVTRDMTERRQYEQRLEEQTEQLERQRDELEQELAAVFERVDDAFYALDDEFRFEYVNDRAETYLGKSEAELLGRTVWEAFDVDGDDPIIERFETAMVTQEPASFERYSDPLGIWETVTVYPSSTGLSVYFRDITERKERERELEESRRRYQTLVDNFPNGAVALVDEDLRYVTVGFF